ncbi:hypothetical protein FNH22_23615 [Fulvivirga sp. M361]|uniref:DUF6503 family protein n=1 Tax=Fulvivirga sp. M361 TaxID=2594266 RepID=UPI001179C6A6|nr:DUF6503 family protein [Fulvivirga sp. M361]TRX51751.1 hypothetical protein FNH22_23615 [Fulvivirga sp. M361]
MKRSLTAILLVSILAACTSSTPDSENTTVEKEVASTDTPIDMSAYPALFQNVLKAHGGLDTWKGYVSLTYAVNSTLGGDKVETHTVDLWNRNVRIESEQYVLGMDGKETWVTPSKEAFGPLPPRFYHNLLFYFFTIPPVLADDGAIYEDLGERTIEDKTYRALKVVYGEGIGDASKDYYIAHFNPETFQLELLLYTVTYFTDLETEEYNVLLYKEWQTADGLLVPAYIEGHFFKDGKIGDLRYKVNFTDVKFSAKRPEPSLFTMPEGAEIDSLIVH